MTNFDQWLECEDRLDLWAPSVRDVRLWPLIRFGVMMHYEFRRAGYGSPFVRINSLDRIGPARWRSLIQAAYRFRQARTAPGDAMFVSSAGRRVASENERHSIDRHHGHYYNLFERPWIFEFQVGNYRPKPDPTQSSRIVNADLMWAVAVLQASCMTLQAGELRLIHDLADVVTRTFDLDAPAEYLANMIARKVAQSVALKARLRFSTQSATSHRYAFVTEASYMNAPYTVFVSALRESGFRVFEVQHGLVYPHHAAYNFSPQAHQNQDHPARELLPHVLLTYGNWWHGQIRYPEKCVAVGCQYLNDTVDNIQSKGGHNPRRILIISARLIENKLSALAKDLAAALPDHQIVFKLHPMEPPPMSQLNVLAAMPNVQIEHRSNIYEEIGKCGSVVGYYSTALFEAAAFEHKRIFFLDGLGVPGELGQAFNETDELIEMLKDPDLGHPNIDTHAIWAPDWKRRIRTVLDLS